MKSLLTKAELDAVRIGDVPSWDDVEKLLAENAVLRSLVVWADRHVSDYVGPLLEARAHLREAAEQIQADASEAERGA